LQGDNSIGRILFRRGDEQLPASRHRHEDDSHRQEHSQHHRVQGISAGHGQNSYRGLVKVLKSAANARNFSQCDSLLIGNKCGAHTFPIIEVKNTSSAVEHEASTLKDWRGSDLLLQSARTFDTGRREYDRERLLQGSVSRNCRWNSPWKRRETFGRESRWAAWLIF